MKTKKEKKILTTYQANYLEINACWWCITNGIKIYPVVEGKESIRTYVSIENTEISKENKLIKSPKLYTNLELTKVIYNLYSSLFFKYADKEIIENSKHRILKSSD